MTAEGAVLETERQLCSLQGHSNSVTDVAATQNGRCTVSAFADGRLRARDVETGASIASITRDSNPGSCVSTAARII